MIRALCLNPIIDRTYYIDDYQVGTKFMEIPSVCSAGGKGVNSARVMAQMGEPCVLYAFVGGATGQMIVQDMESYGVEGVYFETRGETRTAIDIIDARNGRETEIVEPGEEITKEEEQAFFDRLEADLRPGDIVICSGIRMPGMELSVFGELARLAERKGALCALDVDSKYFASSFPAKYFYAKPNLTELKRAFGIQGELTDKDMPALAKKVAELGVETFMISQGGQGSLLFTGEGIFKARIPKVNAVNTIGSGDSTVAGFCIGRARGLSVLECARLAMACGISNAMHSQVGFVEKDQVEELLGQVTIQPLEV